MAKKRTKKKRALQRPLRLQLEEAQEDLADLRRRHHESTRQVDKLQRAFHEADDKAYSLSQERDEMLQNYYLLGQTLTAIRAKWMLAQEKLDNQSRTYSVSAKVRAVPDGTNECDEGPPHGS